MEGIVMILGSMVPLLILAILGTFILNCCKAIGGTKHVPAVENHHCHKCGTRHVG